MNADMLDFLEANAKFMAADRSTIFSTEESAFEFLMGLFDQLSLTDKSFDTLSSGGYELQRYEEDGVVEYRMLRVLSSFVSCAEENDFYAVNWTDDSKALKFGVDLPDLETVELADDLLD